jgi:hypothetical protein
MVDELRAYGEDGSGRPPTGRQSPLLSDVETVLSNHWSLAILMDGG